MKKKAQITKNIIIQKETDSSVSQLRFSFNQLIILFIAFATLTFSIIFTSANYLSKYLYQKRLDEFKLNYSSIESSIQVLNQKLKNIDFEILKIEEKDGAIRSYAGMPTIDKDIRKFSVFSVCIISILQCSTSRKYNSTINHKLLNNVGKDHERFKSCVNLRTN